MNRALQGGCQVPIGAFAEMQDNDHIWLRGLVGAVDGSQIIHGDISGPKEQAEELGKLLAEQLLAQGADDILRAVYGV